MNILFMSALFPKEKNEEIRLKMKVDMNDAANALQWNIINGIENNGGNDLFIVNNLPVDSWPKNYKDMFVKEFPFSHKAGAKDINPAYCNAMYIKQLLMNAPFAKHVEKWCTTQDGDKAIIAYSLLPVFLKAIKKAKFLEPNIKAFAVVADLPEFVVLSKNRLKQLGCNYYKKQIANLLKYVDGFILLSSHMADKLKINVPYLVMEGIAPEKNVFEKDKTTIEHSDNNVRTILYTGSMNAQYGIITLLEAFSQITEPNIVLELYGLGDAEQTIQEYAEKYKRIHFFGKASHIEILQKQESATVLVNPRQNNEEFTKYSFPSKTMEYLASGTPVVAYKLDGIPDEYDEYITYVNDNSVQSLKDSLLKICQMTADERREIGIKAQKFVLDNKNANIQSKKICNFIDTFYKDIPLKSKTN